MDDAVDQRDEPDVEVIGLVGQAVSVELDHYATC
jgi:hypothetical protein